MLRTLFYFFCFFMLCGVIIVFVFFGNLAGATETQACPPRQFFCVPDVSPPACERRVRWCTSRVSGWEGSDEWTRKFYIPIGALLIAKGMPRSPTDSLFWHFSKIEENIYET